MMSHYICVKCQKQMRPEKNGVFVLEKADFGPYQIWHADLWKCPQCEVEIIAGFGARPYAEHYEPGFTGFLEKIQPEYSF